MRGGSCRPVVEDSNNFDEEQDPNLDPYFMISHIRVPIFLSAYSVDHAGEQFCVIRQ